MDYDKPHLSFDDQVEHLRRRGLRISDPADAVALLRRVGYYRLSAYAYPLRILLGPDEARSSSVQYRRDEFMDGASLELVEKLWRFDRELRLLLIDALEAIEIGLRVQLSYVLGRRDAFGHLNPRHLDEASCARPGPDGAALWDTWVARHLRAQDAAKSEDFVRHYVEKYDGRLPIWVATEIMEFGALVRLFGFLRDDDRSEIARALGTNSGTVMYGWLKTIAYLRNVSAHHGRLWNRRLTYAIARPSPQAPSAIVHLRELDNAQRAKVYAAAVVVAHIASSLSPTSDWPRRFAELMTRFPANDFVSPERDMGFPSAWREQELWR